MPNRSTTTPQSLRDLALDHLAALAAELRKKDPTLTREKAAPETLEEQGDT
jgi:hypothetical protein